MKRLIVNADDFGLTPGVNRAICELHEAGVLTSATLMANGAAFDDAVILAKQHPKLDVGCHVVLVDGRPVCPAESVPSLVSRAAGASAFRASLMEFVADLYRRRIREADIEREAIAQIQKLQHAGVHVTHVDTHKHTHMFSRVLRPLLGAAEKTGVRAIRNPFEVLDRTSHPGLSRPGLHRGKTPVKRGLQVGILSPMRGPFKRMVRVAGIRTTDGTVGVIITGARDFEARLEEIVDRLPEGTWELVCHPGHVDADLAVVETRLRGSRQLEINALLTELAKEKLTARGIELADFKDLNPTAPPRINTVRAAGALE